MCVNRMCEYGLYYELHSIAYLHISFISSVDMELTSSGIHGAGGLEAVQGFIQDYKLLVLQEGGIRHAPVLQYYSLSLVPRLIPRFSTCCIPV